MKTDNRATIDKRQVARAYSRFLNTSALATITAEWLGDMLDDMRLTPRHILDVGGDGFEGLRTRYPQASLWALDLALPRLQHSSAHVCLCADAEYLPLQDGVVDLLWSNLCYEWTDFSKSLAEAARVMKTGGLFIAATLGVDTLREARAAFADDGCAHIHDFTDMHDLGEALLRVGMTEPIIHCERLTFNYASAEDALREIHNQGAGCARHDRMRGLMGRKRWRQALANYEHHFTDKEGCIPATYEVIYAIAWRGMPPSQEKSLHFFRSAFQ